MHHDRLPALRQRAEVVVAQRVGPGRVAQVVAETGRATQVVVETGQVAQVVAEVVVRHAVGPRRRLLLDQHLVDRVGARVLGREVGHRRRGGLRVGGHLVPEDADVPLVVQGHPDRQGLPDRGPLRHRDPRLDDLLRPGRQAGRVDDELQLQRPNAYAFGGSEALCTWPTPTTQVRPPPRTVAIAIASTSRATPSATIAQLVMPSPNRTTKVATVPSTAAMSLRTGAMGRFPPFATVDLPWVKGQARPDRRPRE